MNFEALKDTDLLSLARQLGWPTRNFSREATLQRLKQTVTITDRSAVTTTTPSRRITRLALQKITRIQRWWKKHPPRLPVNDSDFFTLEPIQGRPFYLVEDTGHVYQFHPQTLAEYFRREGNFTNPYTRKPLNPIELRRLDRRLQALDPSQPSLYEERQRLIQLRAQEREHLRVCQWLQAECWQHIQQALQAIRTCATPQLTTLWSHLESSSVAQFFHNFRQLFVLDQAFACEAIRLVADELQRLQRESSWPRQGPRFRILGRLAGALQGFVTQVLPALPAVLPELRQLEVPVQ